MEISQSNQTAKVEHSGIACVLDQASPEAVPASVLTHPLSTSLETLDTDVEMRPLSSAAPRHFSEYRFLSDLKGLIMLSRNKPLSR
jgi:hypothetical protein